MHLTLAVPGLLALDPPSLAAAPALARLAHHAGAPVERRGTQDALLVAAAGAGPGGTAPLAALGAGFDAGAAYVLRADPVSLIAGRNDVTFAGRIADLAADETAEMMSTLAAHFAHDGLTFHAPRPDAWFIKLDEAPDLTTTPLACVRGAIYPFLPAGSDAGLWRRWLSEMQMLLHAHPVNAARAARGRVPLTGLWIADGGRLPQPLAGPAPAIHAPPGADGDVARGLARLSGAAALPPPRDFAALPAANVTIAGLARADAVDVRQLESRWLAPALAALERGALASLALVADGGGAAAAWHASRPGGMRRLWAGLAARPFAPPAGDGDET